MKKALFEKIRQVALLQKSKDPLLFFLQDGEDYLLMRGEKEILRGKNLSEIMEKAGRHYEADGFRRVDFGVLYTMPERDEVGQYALFHQARLSYKVSNGVVFDTNLGYAYKVDFLSKEGRKIIEDLERNVEP